MHLQLFANCHLATKEEESKVTCHNIYVMLTGGRSEHECTLLSQFVLCFSLQDMSCLITEKAYLFTKVDKSKLNKKIKRLINYLAILRKRPFVFLRLRENKLCYP